MFENYYKLLENFIRVQDFYTAFISLTIFKALTAIFFLPGTPFTILSGSLLGTFWGSISAIIGNAIGAILAFLLARYFLYSFVQNKILPKYKNLEKYEKNFLEDKGSEKIFTKSLQTILFLRLVPLFPFNVLNFVLAVTKVKFKDYAIGTTVGIIPGTIAFVYFGDSIRTLSIINILFAILAIFGLSYVGKFWNLK
jgi:uncharacterized membrane protein YdjX (TVP38/TMEM64 family)